MSNTAAATPKRPPGCSPVVTAGMTASPGERSRYSHGTKHTRGTRRGSRPRHHPMVLTSRKMDCHYGASVSAGAALTAAPRLRHELAYQYGNQVRLGIQREGESADVCHAVSGRL